MKDRAIEIYAAPPRGTPTTGETGARRDRDAVGRVVAVGDTVTALRGRSVSRAVVERVAGSRLVLRRDDGVRAVFNAGSVVVLKRVRQDGAGVAS